MGDTAGVNGGMLRLRLVELCVWRILHGINVIVRLGKTFVYARVCSFALTIVGRTCIGCMDHKQIIILQIAILLLQTLNNLAFYVLT